MSNEKIFLANTSFDFSDYYYDGKTLQHFTTKEGLVSNNISSIHEDKAGNIWFGANGGASRYDPSAHFGSAQHKSLRAGGSTFTNFSENNIRYLCEDKSGNIWGSGTVNGKWALSRFDEKSLADQRPTVIEIPESLNLFGVFEANDGNIWFGSGGPESGVYRYDGKTVTDFKGAADH